MDTPSKTDAPTTAGDEGRARDFIRQIIEDDLQTGKHQRVVTRFPPEPNGYLHIGHAKSICLNFGVAKEYGGVFHLRFDDTNPTKEETEYVESIQADVRWLGGDWGDNLFYASDYFERLYQHAVLLIEAGKAYVCHLSKDEVREQRGTLTEPGRPSPYRDRTVAENLDLFERMRAGEFAAGECVLRAKIDMASPNMIMRDPPIYRILHAHHHRTGDAWCIYPMYDFTHCLSDSFEGITHSLCTLEFENNREIYDWVLDNTPVDCHPRQIEFARLNLGFTVLSKRKLLQLVGEGHVAGWDDPRMPSVAAFRRRGVRPEAIRALCDLVGVSKANSLVDIGKLEFCIRDDLNQEAPRVMSVLRPLKVVITNYPEGQTETLEAPYWPHDVPREGSRQVPFSREIYIEREDFEQDPPPRYFRLAPGREVRLRYAYLVRCEDVVTDPASGEVVEVHCTYDPASRGGTAPDGRKVKGTLHWVDAAGSLPCEVRLYDRLFSVEKPDALEDFKDALNAESLTTLDGCRVEPSVAADPPETRYQFERQGYFWRDPVDGRRDRLVFNRIVTLRDSWAKIAGEAAGAAPAEAPRRKKKTREGRQSRPSRKSRTHARAEARAASPELEASFERFQQALGLGADEADLLSADVAVARFFDAAVAAHDSPAEVAKWVINELLGAVKDTTLDALPFDGAALGALVALVEDQTISTKAAKDVLDELIAKGGDPRAIVERRGLQQIADPTAVEPLVAEVIAAHPDKVAAYRAGKTGLLGFFVGQVMRQSRGRANPELVKTLLAERLAG